MIINVRRTVVFKVAAILLCYAFSAATGMARSVPSPVAASYPVFSPESVGKTPALIVSMLEDKMILDLSDVIDLANAHAYLGRTDMARTILRNAIAEGRYESGRSDLLKFKAMTVVMEAQQTESVDRQRGLYSEALSILRDAHRLAPSLGTAEHIVMLANLSEDPLEIKTAEDLLKRLNPDGAGQEVFDPITGAVILVVVAALAATLTNVYLTREEPDRATTIEAYKTIATITAAGLAVLAESARQG